MRYLLMFALTYSLSLKTTTIPNHPFPYFDPSPTDIISRDFETQTFGIPCTDIWCATKAAIETIVLILVNDRNYNGDVCLYGNSSEYKIPANLLGDRLSPSLSTGA